MVAAIVTEVEACRLRGRGLGELNHNQEERLRWYMKGRFATVQRQRQVGDDSKLPNREQVTTASIYPDAIVCDAGLPTTCIVPKRGAIEVG